MSDVSTEAPRQPRRIGRGTRILIFFVPLMLVLGSGAYTAASALAPLPDHEFTLTAGENASVTASASAAQAIVDAQPLPTAIGWLHGENDGVGDGVADGADGADAVWSNDSETYPLGSISKLIMMLVALEHKPLEPGTEGETYVWSASDAALTAGYMAVNGVSFNIPVGTELTQRDMLKLIFLPSANDVAHAYTLWTFGSVEAFVAAFDEWKSEHGLDSVTLVEPTGMDTDNRANAADLVRVSRLALENPTITEFTGMQSADMPWGIGTIYNSNPLLGEMPGIVGLKTGTIYSIYNLIAAQEVSVDGIEAVNISVTINRGSQEARAAAGQSVLESMAALPKSVPVVESGEILGTLTSAHGETVDLVASETVFATLLPGESATRTVQVVNDWNVDPEAAGTVSVSSPTGSTEVAIHRTGTLTEPDLWWRLTHPSILFG